MPEMSFGRSIRYRRSKLGLSQTRLGELVGRSGAAVRSWERDSSTPTDPGVLQALSAVLGIEKEVLFDKAGVEVPAVETSPTVEEVLGSLTPNEVREDLAPQTTAETVRDELEEPEAELEYQTGEQGKEDPMSEVFDLPDEVPPAAPSAPVTVSVVASSTDARPAGGPPGRVPPAFTSSQPRYLFTTPAPPLPEPTYMEDETQRQLYRIRNLATLVITVGLIVLFVWALGNSWEEFTSWWDDFLSTLQL